MLKIRFQDRTPERQPQPSKTSDIENARHVNNEGEQAQSEPISEVFARDNIRGAPITTTSPDKSAEVQVPSSDANQKDVASSHAEPVPDVPTTRPQCSTGLHGNPIMGRGSIGELAGDHRRSEERDNDPSKPITRVAGDALAPLPHCFSRFEPAPPGVLHTNAGHEEPGNDGSSEVNGVESLDVSVINVADIGLTSPKMSDASGNSKYPHSLTHSANAGNPALIGLASRILEENIAAARSSQNLESIARQAWDSSQVTGPERVRASPEDASQPSGSRTSPLTELSLTITEESAHAGSANCSQSATARPRGPSALRPLHFGQLQRDSRKTLQDFEGEFFQTARKSCMSPAPARDRERHWSSDSWPPAIRNAVGSNLTSSSSVKETQGPLPEPVCLTCRKKKKRCDRQKPRCKWLCNRRDLSHC